MLVAHRHVLLVVLVRRLVMLAVTVAVLVRRLGAVLVTSSLVQHVHVQ